MVEVQKPEGMTGSEFSRAIHFLSTLPISVERINKNRPGDTYIAHWDDAVAPVPTAQEIVAARDAIEQARQDEQSAVTGAVEKLINNADLIKQAMDGIADARAALDTAIPIDDTTTQTALNSLAQRQAAVMFLAANSLRASVHLAKTGTLPDEVIEAFLK